MELTPRGLTLVEEVEPVYRKNIHDVFSDLDDAACVRLIRELERIRQRVEALD
ncbi:MAG: hypothetical protein HC888_09445 [Candidatus Competibacteraceae bacterium]|nr:hypothetical protein [Candidatus Competibacteraceae bacterium]